MKYTSALFIVLVLTGCHRHFAYHRQDVRYDYILWRESHPTTFHGICASLLGPTLTPGGENKLWEVDHPYGHRVNSAGDIGSVGDQARAFPDRASAITYAESICPTHP